MLIDDINIAVKEVFESFGLDASLGQVQGSDRPDISDYQCNGALRAAKILNKNPLAIAQEIAQRLGTLDYFAKVEATHPGFINFTMAEKYVVRELIENAAISVADPQKIVIDYGGPNVAKPLHVGHLRPAIIGEAIKRNALALGHKTVGDVHLGDWGTPMGQIIAELELRHPDWPYFQDNFAQDDSTAAPPLTVEKLNEIYPAASGKAKEDKDFADIARAATARLQDGHAGYRALWKHFVKLSTDSIRENYDRLDVHFDLWLGESDAAPLIDDMVQSMIDKGIAVESQGALIIEVKENDEENIPPLILKKSDGAVTYATTDLATIMQRVRDFSPDKIFYVVDKRQATHFEQVFRAADKAGIIARDKLEHIGFGTINGKDKKPFKTRDGGVMQLKELIDITREFAIAETGFSASEMTDEIRTMAEQIAIAAVKFGDLSNPRMSDYVFSPQEVARFEGKTGPYLQYAAVRARAILEKVSQAGIDTTTLATAFSHEQERALAFALIGYNKALLDSHEKRMPNILCEYLYSLAKAFSNFYKNCPVMDEPDPAIKNLRIYLTQRTATALRDMLEILAIPLPEKMMRAEAAE